MIRLVGVRRETTYLAAERVHPGPNKRRGLSGPASKSKRLLRQIGQHGRALSPVKTVFEEHFEAPNYDACSAGA